MLVVYRRPACLQTKARRRGAPMPPRTLLQQFGASSGYRCGLALSYEHNGGDTLVASAEGARGALHARARQMYLHRKSAADDAGHG